MIDQITVYAIKHDRKNAKANIKESLRFYGENTEKLKRTFTKDNIIDFKSWLQMQSKQNKKFKLIVYQNNNNLHNWYSTTFTDWESCLKKIIVYATLLNSLKDDIDFTQYY